MDHFISIIIPNYNGSQTVGKCLDFIFAGNDDDREVIVVDDCSEDNSVDIIKKYPCKLVSLTKRAGASAARNAGAFRAKGDVLFFIDADCLLQENTLPAIRKNLARNPRDVAVGGTYTPTPHDRGFFSLFQSVFVNFFETKNRNNPDYLATHALVIHAETFRKLGGFTEKFLPILEDVEFSHRLRNAGCKLIIDPELQVRHIFNFSLFKSLRNAARKTRYWMVYSLMNRDLLADSGTASREIKLTGVAWLMTVLLALLSVLSGYRELLIPVPFLWGFTTIVNRYLFQAFYKTGGILFAIQAAVYYLFVYPLPVWLGALRGIVQYMAPGKAIEFLSLLKGQSQSKKETQCTRRSDT